MTSGKAYLYGFPFDIILDHRRFAIQTVRLKRHDVSSGIMAWIYPPFLNRTQDNRPIELITPDRMPHRPGTLPPDETDFPALESIAPSIQPAGRQIQLADALRIDFNPDPGHPFARKFARELMNLVRISTRQWWIGRLDRLSDAYLRNSVDIDRLGQITDAVVVAIKFKTPFGWEEPLDAIRFHKACSLAARGTVPSFSSDLILDAAYYAYSGDIRRSVLDLAISIEVKLDETANRLKRIRMIDRGQARQMLASSKIVERIALLESWVDVSFRQDHSDEFRLINSLATARGFVAHGRPTMRPKSPNELEVTEDNFVEVFSATTVLFSWLDEL